MAFFIKPEITFSPIPFFNRYMEYDYDEVQTYEDLIEFTHKWLADMETTKNPIRKSAIKKIVVPLYSIITNKSYQSKRTWNFTT